MVTKLFSLLQYNWYQIIGYWRESQGQNHVLLNLGFHRQGECRLNLRKALI